MQICAYHSIAHQPKQSNHRLIEFQQISRLIQNAVSELQYNVSMIQRLGTQIDNQFPHVQLESFGIGFITSEIDKMRTKIKDLNQDLNDIMERNQNQMLLRQAKKKQQVKKVNTSKIYQSIMGLKQSNKRILIHQQKQMHKLKFKLSSMEGKDPIRDYEGETLALLEMIDEEKKKIRHMKVKMEKVSKQIQKVQEVDDISEFKRENQLKLVMVQTMKKSQEYLNRQVNLIKSLQEAEKQNEEIDDKYRKYKNLAGENNLDISINGAYTETVKRYNQLQEKVVAIKKNNILLEKKYRKYVDRMIQENEQIKKINYAAQLTKMNEQIKKIQQQIEMELDKIKSDQSKNTIIRDRYLKLEQQFSPKRKDGSNVEQQFSKSPMQNKKPVSPNIHKDISKRFYLDVHKEDTQEELKKYRRWRKMQESQRGKGQLSKSKSKDQKIFRVDVEKKSNKKTIQTLQ